LTPTSPLKRCGGQPRSGYGKPAIVDRQNPVLATGPGVDIPAIGCGQPEQSANFLQSETKLPCPADKFQPSDFLGTTTTKSPALPMRFEQQPDTLVGVDRLDVALSSPRRPPYIRRSQRLMQLIGLPAIYQRPNTSEAAGRCNPRVGRGQIAAQRRRLKEGRGLAAPLSRHPHPPAPGRAAARRQPRPPLLHRHQPFGSEGGSGLDLIPWHRQKAGTIEHAHDVLMNELAGSALPSQKFGANGRLAVPQCDPLQPALGLQARRPTRGI
jgi:hypothetical protein